MYLLKGERSSLLLFGKMKQAMKNKRKSRGQVIIWREKSKGFWATTYFLELQEGSCQEKQDYGNSGRNMDVYIFSWVSLFKRPIRTYSSSHQKGFSFEPIINAGSSLFIEHNKEAMYVFNHLNMSW